MNDENIKTETKNYEENSICSDDNDMSRDIIETLTYDEEDSLTFDTIEERNSELDRRNRLLLICQSRNGVSTLRKGINQLKKDVELSMGLCGTDFQMLGNELVTLLNKKNEVNININNEIKDLKDKLYNEQQIRKVLTNELIETKGNIRVFCRIRPLLQEEIDQSLNSCISVSNNNNNNNIQDLLVKQKISNLYGNSSTSAIHSEKRYTFHQVFDETKKLEEVYEQVSPLVVSAMNGYHSCVFAYGQTGSGKTYTMEGKNQDGIYHKSIQEIFSIQKNKIHTEEIKISLQMVEIYNEVIYDLLDGNCNVDKSNNKVEMRKERNGYHLNGASNHLINNSSEAFELLEKGNQNRSVSSTNANKNSSRSHSLLLLTINSFNHISKKTTRGKLVLVDLAGSERLSKTEATGDRLREAQNINRSLSALGDVMTALLSKTKDNKNHVPFRNSKLTHVLQDSLGKNNKALMLVHVNPTENSAGETICSLNFASRVRKIELGNAKKNYDHSMNNEIFKLKQMVEKQATQYREIQQKLEEEKNIRNELEHQIVDINKTNANIINNLQKKIDLKETEIQSLKIKLNNKQLKDRRKSIMPNNIVNDICANDDTVNEESFNGVTLRRSRRLSNAPTNILINTNINKQNDLNTMNQLKRPLIGTINQYKSILKKSKLNTSQLNNDDNKENQPTHIHKKVMFDPNLIEPDSPDVIIYSATRVKKNKSRNTTNETHFSLPSTLIPLRRSTRNRLGPAARVPNNNGSNNTNNTVSFHSSASRVPKVDRRPKWI